MQKNITCETSKSIDNNGTNNYNSFDIAKLICSILVVIIHIAPFGEQSNNIYTFMNFGLQQCLCRIAVPLFFMLNGFFLFKKLKADNFSLKYCKLYFCKIAKLYIIWTLIYFPIALINMINHPRWIITYIKSTIFTGSHYHLWYLNALLTAVFLISFLLYKKWNFKKILCISFVFYLFGVLGDGYYGLIFPLFNMPFWGMILKIYFKLFSTTRNGLFFAFFFVALGMFFANREVSIDRKKLFFFFGISVILLVLEVYMLQVFNIPKDHNILIFIVPSAIFAFLCLIKIKLKNNVIYTYIRKMSSLTFYLHPWILLIYTKSSEFLNINIQGTPIPFLFVLFVAVVLSITIIKLSKTKYFKWLKNIY